MKGVLREPFYPVICSQLSISARTRERREVLYLASSVRCCHKAKKVASLFILTIV